MDKKPTTRQKVLSAACKVFAEKGFHDSTIAEICETADANIASVNYHFGDKESLYDEVWRHAFDITAKAYPLDGGTDSDSLEDSLYNYASSFLHRIFSENETGLFAKLLYREMAAPTLALDKIADEVLFPQNQHLGDIIENVLGEDFDEQQLKLCKNSIIGQCAFYNFSRPLRERVMGKKGATEEEINSIARHIARFSVGGLKEITA